MNHIGTHDTERAITRLAGENPDGHDRAWQFEHNTLSEFDYLKGISMMKIASLIQFTLRVCRQFITAMRLVCRV